MTQSNFIHSKEKTRGSFSGWLMLCVFFLLLASTVLSLLWVAGAFDQPHIKGLFLLIPLFLLTVLLPAGFFTLQPNQACVTILFGAYKGTVKASGFHWVNPFLSKKKISLRSRNFNGDRLKVNDKQGNPIEIAAVVVWRVQDTAQALFDVDDYSHYVNIQSESAVRHLATQYSYNSDESDPEALTLLSSGEEIAKMLQAALQDRLNTAGVLVEEARITHLAYAPEIASAMLRRQQAEAIISARQKIVHGAVSMVEMALHELSSREVIELDEERKASMVSNLLVVLCSDSDATPVINTGTLYP